MTGFIDELLAEVIGQQVALMSAVARLEARTDGEALHDLRIALRRLRSLLRSIRGVPGVEELEHAAAEVGRLSGPIRDLEVLLPALAAEGLRDALAVRRLGAGVRLRGGSRQPAAAPPAALPGRLAGPVAYGPAACRAGWPARPGAQAPAPAMEDPARRAGGHHLRALAPATAADQARALRAGGLSARLQHSRLAAGAAQGGPVGAGRLARPRTVAVAMPARAGPGARARGLDGTLRTGPGACRRALSTLQQALAEH